MDNFQGKVAFVTGAASGIGLALARAFGRARMKVMLADIEMEALGAALEDLRREGIDARGVCCDVAIREAVEHAAAETLAAFGKVHILCNNAGVGCGGPMEVIRPGDWDWVIGVNLMAVVHGIRTFLPHIKAQGEGGHILTTASQCGMNYTSGLGPYNATKAAAVALSETLAAELAGTSIGVTVLCPGFVRTRIVNSARNRPGRYGDRTESSPEAEAVLSAFVQSGLEPEAVAERAMRAIENNELHIFTHPEMRKGLEERFQRILAAFPEV